MFLLLGFFGCRPSYNALDTVPVLDITKYAGIWYEIARLPNSFERKLECVTATYSLRDDGKIKVVNKGHLISNHAEVKEITGVAWVPDKKAPAKLKVSFFRPFAGKYWVLDLNDDYTCAMVGDPSRKYFWILSKKRTIDEGMYNTLLEKAIQKGFDIQKIIKVKQVCDKE